MMIILYQIMWFVKCVNNKHVKYVVCYLIRKTLYWMERFNVFDISHQKLFLQIGHSSYIPILIVDVLITRTRSKQALMNPKQILL